MALKNISNAAAAAATPPFELDDDTVVTSAPAAAAETVVESAAPAAAAATAAPRPAAKPPAVSTPRTTALAKPKVNMADHDVLGQLENVLPPVEYGEGERLTITNGAVFDGENRSLGDSITMTVLSWNYRYVISPGDQGKEAKEHARYSMDGVTTTQGENIEEYLHMLRNEMGYTKAARKEYMDIFGILEDSAKPSALQGTSLTLSASPDTVKTFKGFRRNLVVQGVLGRLPEALHDISAGVRLKVQTEARSGNGNNWTRGNFSLAE